MLNRVIPPIDVLTADSDVQTTIPRISRTRASAILFLAECISFAFTVAQGVLLVPLYLHFIATPLYGAWLATGQALGWLGLADPGADMVVRQRVARAFGAREMGTIGRWIGSGLLINAGAGSAILLMSLILAAWVPGLFGLEPGGVSNLRTALLWGAAANSLVTVSYSLASPLQALQRPLEYAMVMIAANVAGICANVLLLFSGWGLMSIPLGWLVRGLVLVAGWGIALLHVWLRLGLGGIRGSVHQTLEILRPSAFTFLSKAGSALQNSTDAFLAGVMLGPVSAAKLILTGRLIDALRTFPERFASAAQPSLAHLFGEGDRDRSTAVALRFLRSGSLVTALLVGLAVALNKEVMTVWVGPQLFAGYGVTLALGTAAAVLTVTNLGNQVLFAHGEIEKPAKAFFAYGVAKCALAASLAHPIGILIFPLAAIVAAGLTYSREVRRMVTVLVRSENHGWPLLGEIGRGFAICFAIAVGFWWFDRGFGPRWVAVSARGMAVLVTMLTAVALGAKRQTLELRIVLAQGMPNWRIAAPWLRPRHSRPRTEDTVERYPS